MRVSLYLLSALLLVGFNHVTADTPADCRYEQIKGDWIFYESDRTFTTDNVDCSEMGEVAKEIKITLSHPNIAQDGDGNKGTWTLIYNQGFEVIINGREFFAFSEYEEIKRKVPCLKEDPTECREQEIIRVKSICDKTKIGWSHTDKTEEWACYRGEKVQPLAPNYHTTTRKLDTGKYKINMDYLHNINSSQTSWWTRVYDKYETMTHEDLLRMKGGYKSYLPNRPKPAAVSKETLEKLKDLPEEIDYRNIDGVNYMPPTRDQGFCGSCYIFGSTGGLEGRLRKMTNNENQVILSPQDALECSEYGQGCDGGFPYLTAGKYGKDFGFVEEECRPYSAMDLGCSNSDYPDCTRHYTKSYGYIGGYYGAGNEAEMMLSLVNDGPLPIGFMVFDDFIHYGGGIYHHTGLTDGYDPFVAVNHAVTLCGYGKDEATGEKFWILQNSWGSSWGDDGYFKIARGHDEAGVESIPCEFIPIP